MTAPVMIINNYLRSIMSYIRVSQSYFRRRNPFMNMLIGYLNELNNLLSLNKRAKAMKYQVQVHYYKMKQMEKMVNDYNPYNSQGGNSLNKYR